MRSVKSHDIPSNEEIPSKTERKREADALQKLALKLAELNNKQLSQIPMSENLARALADYGRFTSRGARRRQAQYLGKLMRKEDIAPIEQNLAILENEDATANYHRHQAEIWRDRLCEHPEDLTEFFNTAPLSDHQLIKNLIRKIQKAKSEHQAKPSRRELYRVIYAEFSKEKKGSGSI